MQTNLLLSFLFGSASLVAALLVIIVLAVIVEYAVTLLHGKVSPLIRSLVHRAAMLLLVFDLAMLIAFAAAHAWHTLPIAPHGSPVVGEDQSR
jgi:phage-related holin